MGRTSGGTSNPWRWTREGGSMDQPAAPPEAAVAPVRWQWAVEAGPAEGPIDTGAESLAGGLRVAVASATPVSSRAATHAVEEGSPGAVLVGYVRWPSDAWPATEQSGWAGAEVRVEWLVALSPRGVGTVAFEAVPRLHGAAPCPVLLEEYRIRRTLPVGQAIVLFTEGPERSTPVAQALVGAREGMPGRFVIRVRP